MIFAFLYACLGVPLALGAGKDYRVVIEDRDGGVLAEGSTLSAVSSGGESESTTLRDDGVNPDSKAKDGFWTASLTVSGADAVWLTVTTPTGVVTGSGSVDKDRPDLRMILSNSQLVPERGNEVKGAYTPTGGATTSSTRTSTGSRSVAITVASWSDFDLGVHLWGWFAVGMGCVLGGCGSYVIWKRTAVPTGGLRGRWQMRMVDEWQRPEGRPSVVVGPGDADTMIVVPVTANEVLAYAGRLGPRTVVGVTDVSVLDRVRPDESALDALIRIVDGRFEVQVARALPAPQSNA